MALIKCKDCDKEVSTEAKACLHCGVPVLGQGMGCVGRLLVAGVIVFAGVLVVGMLVPIQEKDSFQKTADLFCEQAHRDAKTSLEKMAADKECERWRQTTDRLRAQKKECQSPHHHRSYLRRWARPESGVLMQSV